MNILYFFPERDTYMYQWQRLHIFDELERNGHFIQVFNPVNYLTVTQANEQLIIYLKKNKGKFNLFMNCASSDFLFKETVEEVKKIGLYTLLICFDNLHAPYNHRKIASSFNLVWLTSKETKGMFEKWGCKNIIFQTYAANPYKFTPCWNRTIQAVSFVGNPYGSRINKLNMLTAAGVECNVYSEIVINNENSISLNKKLAKEVIRALSFNVGRKVLYSSILNKYIYKKNSTLNKNSLLALHPSVSFEDMQKIYSNSSLSLNITDLRNTYVLQNPIHKMHLRTFEIPMCGGLELATYTDELAGYFEDGKEIVMYKSADEYISKARFYLDPKNNTTSYKMKEKARLRAESDHTWMKRFHNVFANL